MKDTGGTELYMYSTYILLYYMYIKCLCKLIKTIKRAHQRLTKVTIFPEGGK